MTKVSMTCGARCACPGPSCCDDDRPYRRITAVLLLRAVRDVRCGNREAAEWLAGAETAAWADLLELANWPPAGERR